MQHPEGRIRTPSRSVASAAEVPRKQNNEPVDRTVNWAGVRRRGGVPKCFTDAQLLTAISSARSWYGAAALLGIAFETLKKKCAHLTLDTSHFKKGIGVDNPNYRTGVHVDPRCACGRPKDYRARACSRCSRRGFARIRAHGQPEPYITNSRIVLAVKLNTSVKAAAMSLGIGRTTLKRYIDRLGLSTRHFDPTSRGRSRTDAEFFVNDSAAGRITVRYRYARLQRIAYRCVVCGQSPTWNGSPLTLQCDHINGVPSDNRLSNLRWLCPNCHSQQKTSYGHNIGRMNREKRMNNREKDTSQVGAP